MTSPNHLPESELARRLQDAREQIPVGTEYAHYKHPDNLYVIVGHSILEATDEPAVTYQAQYGEKIPYTRAVMRFLEDVEWQGQTVPRFTRIDSQPATE